MKYTWILLCMFWFAAANAQANIETYLLQNKQHFEQAVVKDKIIIQFKTNVSTEEKQAVFAAYNFLQPYDERLETGSNQTVMARLFRPVANYNMLNELLKQIATHHAVAITNPVVRQENNNPVFVLNPIFFSLKNNASLPHITAALKELGIEQIKAHAMLKNIFQLENNKYSGFNNLELASYLNNLEVTAFAEPNYGLFVDACVVNDQYFPRQWNIQNTGSAQQGNGTPDADMNVVNAWEITTGSPNVKIAVLDSGVDTLHPDLRDNILPGFDATGFNSKGSPNTRFSSDAHGTACSGIIAAPANNMGLGIAGVAYGCKIIPIRIFYYVDSIFTGQVTPYAESQWMADGIAWAWQFGDADVMSNSWAVQDLLMQILPGSPTLVDTAIAQVYTFGRDGKGIPLFFSSGNEGGLPYWPGRKPETFAINATSMCDERKSTTSCDGENWTGNWKSTLDFGAPGVRIPTTDISGNKGYSTGDYTLTFNGTSAACPNAAAVAALLYSVRSDLQVEDVRFIMGMSADKVGGYDYSTQKFAGAWSEELGYGRLNAHRALLMLEGYNVGIRENEKSNVVTIFPNPLTQNIFQITLSNTSEKINAITVISSEGKTIYSQQYKQHTSAVEVTLPENISAGIYFLSIQTESNNYYKKIISQ